MDDMYGDQFVPDMTLGISGASYGNERGSMGVGFYEDNFRQEQYGRSARLECGAPNPYIQDDIRKSQRHHPIRIGSVAGRENQILEKQYADTVVIPSHSLQRTFRVPVLGGDRSPAYCGECSSCGHYISPPGTGAPCLQSAGAQMHAGAPAQSAGAHSANTASTAGGIISSAIGGSEGVPAFLVFIFIVLLFLCIYYWKSISDIKQNLQMIREVLQAR